MLTLVHFDLKPVGTNRNKLILMLMVWHRTYIIIYLKPDMDETSAKCSSETLRIKIFYLSFLSDSQTSRLSFHVQSKKLPVFVFSLSNLTESFSIDSTEKIIFLISISY